MDCVVQGEEHYFLRHLLNSFSKQPEAYLLGETLGVKQQYEQRILQRKEILCRERTGHAKHEQETCAVNQHECVPWLNPSSGLSQKEKKTLNLIISLFWYFRIVTILFIIIILDL